MKKTILEQECKSNPNPPSLKELEAKLRQIEKNAIEQAIKAEINNDKIKQFAKKIRSILITNISSSAKILIKTIQLLLIIFLGLTGYYYFNI